ncbi:MAG: ATPase, T2SS/T4P/T4SS family [Candidatus Delongbacteria bacterium]|jgi:type IV pilus assembly protein PilB|nr:ATPase, T2SS/T4P/T4SS family [Candidatus Delongbacteria bacterium]
MLNAELVNKDEEIIKFVDDLLKKAVEDKVVDIHVEPKDTYTQVRFKKDGVLFIPEGYDKIPKILHSYIIDRIKVLTGTMRRDIDKRPQDGKLRKKIGEIGDVDLRVGTIPTIHGESIVMRVMKNDPYQLDIEKILNNDKYLIDTFKRNIDTKDGVILFSGLSGSGKTTIARAAVNEIAKNPLKIITIEDPVKVVIENTTQVQVSNHFDVIFETAARQAYRMGIDVLYMSEIRNKEVAHMALEGGLTGFLVLSAISTQNAIETLFRLSQMGIKEYLTASTVKFIVSSRLADKLCQHCKEEAVYSETELKAVGLTAKEIKENTFYKSKGCEKCNQRGYSGRLAIIEMLELSHNMKDAFINGGDNEEITKIAKKDGVYYTLADDALKKFKGGFIDLETARKFTL